MPPRFVAEVENAENHHLHWLVHHTALLFKTAILSAFSDEKNFNYFIFLDVAV